MSPGVDLREYYGRVAGEVAEFLRGRWAAGAAGDRWVRWEGDRPLRVLGPGDVLRLVEERGVRSFYGTIEVFRRLEERADVEERYDSNVVAVTSFIDVDVVDESMVGAAWGYALEAARVIAEWLEERGVSESVYLLWSGAGVHVRIHESAFEGADDPLRAAFLVAEYAVRSVRGRLEGVVSRSGGLVKVENLVARKRLFTAPLSLHRRLDYAAVAFKPGDIDGFGLHWLDPRQPRHDPGAWRSGRRGEALDLYREALRALGPSPERSVIARPARLPGGRVARPAPAARPGEPGRFPVMALLQAARYYILNGDLEKAKSFGLNRAIFYAWAKYYGPARSAARRLQALERRGGAPPRGGGGGGGGVVLKRVPGMDEEAPVGPSGWYAMGGVEQKPEDFDRQVARRFEEAGIPFKLAWEAALDYVSRFPESVLRDPQEFYKRVYEPVRDAFVEKVLKPRAEGLRHPLPPGGGPGRRQPRGTARRARSLLDWMRGGEDK